MAAAFEADFEALTGHAPFPWQHQLFLSFEQGRIPTQLELPTGLGKTSIIALWLLALRRKAKVPRRLVYVVNRRTVVDQTTDEVLRLRERSARDFEISTLRGQLADNRAWSADPSRPAVICGTVDMIGSRLLFSGYGLGFKSRPLHAGFLGQDALIVHDEAHLEPAFQRLLERIVEEQRHDFRPLQVMALTATSRSDTSGFQLGAADRKHPVVAQRLEAHKQLHLHETDDDSLVERVVKQALIWKQSSRAVLLFLRTVDDVMDACERLRKAGATVQQLTGTMRGLERDRLATSDPVFARFLPPAGPDAPTVYLVCTSAGEVGVNLSADHLVSDLSTFDSMAQRFGRVNRFGMRGDTEVHVFHPSLADLTGDDAAVLDLRRAATLRLLRNLEQVSPAALGRLSPTERLGAFAPEPEVLGATDMLFDAWAMTTVRHRLPGRPHVEPYLHGVAEWEPPRTQVAWRSEVDELSTPELQKRFAPSDALEDYPLKPHELLSDSTRRVVATLTTIAKKLEAPELVPFWVVDESGEVTVETMQVFLVEVAKDNEAAFGGQTLLLSPRAFRPVEGLLSLAGLSDHDGPGDVADEWLGEAALRLRQRGFDLAAPPGMRRIRTIDLTEADDEEASPRRWVWFELPRTAENDGSKESARAVLLDVHLGDVERAARAIVAGLELEPGVARAVVLAGRVHDLGKKRRLWQQSIGNFDLSITLAKAGRGARVTEYTGYRHELGSVVDSQREPWLAELSADDRELALHLVAAHHGRARPHFPSEERFDPDAAGVDLQALHLQVVQRFDSLQRRFGRWGLAYLESLVRAADYQASASPSSTLEDRS